MSLVRAARTLDSEVQALHPKAKMKVVGEPDGLGKNRTIAYDAATTKWLLPILEAVNDPRIESIDDSGKQTHIVFVPDQRADRGHAYNLAAADEVLNN